MDTATERTLTTPQYFGLGTQTLLSPLYLPGSKSFGTTSSEGF